MSVRLMGIVTLDGDAYWCRQGKVGVAVSLYHDHCRDGANVQQRLLRAFTRRMGYAVVGWDKSPDDPHATVTAHLRADADLAGKDLPWEAMSAY